MASDDPFDLTKLRLKQDFVETAGVKRVYMTVPVGKPGHKTLSVFTQIRPIARLSP